MKGYVGELRFRVHTQAHSLDEARAGLENLAQALEEGSDQELFEWDGRVWFLVQSTDDEDEDE